MTEVQFPEWESYVCPNFVEPFLFDGRYTVLYGGRGSSKSVTAVRKAIFKMVSEPHFKGVCVRKTYNTLKDSCWADIKEEVETLGLYELFTFTKSPLEIRCETGGVMLFRGADDPQKLKGIKNPNFVWYEEANELDEADFTTMTTSVRGKHKGTEIFCFNPELGQDYKDHWIYKRFKFDEHISPSFTDSVELEIEVDGVLTKVTQEILAHQSTYKDNPYLPPEFIANLEEMKTRDPYYYRVYVLGLFGNKKVGDQFYKDYKPDRNSKKTEYNPALPVHISFDENVNPYLPCGMFQFSDGVIYMIDELAMKHPRNTVREICSEIKHRLRGHKEGVYIYGDATSRKSDVKLEKGQNFFKIILSELDTLRPILRLPMKNPSVAMRGRFINELFAQRVEKCSVVIGENCVLTNEDLMYTLETADGTKHKEKGKDKDTGVTYEKRGHFSDLTDYIICELFKNEFITYINGGKIVPLKVGKKRFNPKHRF